jgi:hypothetical protein
VSALELRLDLVVLACAISAGIHAALVSDHFAESVGAGVGFAAATVALAAIVVALTLRPASAVALAGAATVLAGLLAAYGLAITVGVPLLHPDPEPVEGLALVTKAIEAVGLVAAVGLLGRRTGVRPAPLFLATLVALFSALVSLAVSGGHVHHTH